MEMSLTVIVAIIAVVLALKFAKQMASKIIGIIIVAAVVIGVMYQKSWGPFKSNVADIANLQEKYCAPEGDADVCECIVENVQKDLKERFTRDELDSLKVQRLRAAYVLKKSLAATKQKSMECLESKGAGAKYKTFIQDFVPIENKYLDMAEGKIDELKGKVKDEVLSLKDSKRSIDDKY